ncbi:MAG TPA: VWA domain-containing protein [Blastocatellia bacterium]|nr:VWA domain-containing protein [Blastocatellia bacterium]
MNTQAPTHRRSVYCVRSLFLFSLVVATANATLHAQGTAVRVETFSLKPDGEVVVENPRGATRVESWDAETVRVVAEKKAAGAGSIEPGELVLMGAQNSILVQCKPGVGRVDLTLYVPHGSQLQVTGGAWPVDVDGALALATVETTSGNIAYRLAANDDARVSMRSATGTVRSTIPLTAVDRAGVHSLQGQIGSGAARLILNSQSGNVTLTPGPSLNVIAKASSRRVESSDGGGSSDSSDGTQQNGVASRGQSQQSDSGTNYSTSGGQPSQANGSVTFGGSDRGTDASSTTTAGPFVRPRSQRSTSGGDSGLKVRIIPPTSPQNSPRTPSGSVYDQPADQEDPQQGAQGAPSRGSNAPDPNLSASDAAVFAGSDRASDGSSESRIGPLERDRQVRNTSGGNSGLKVRIIPAPATNGSSRNSSSVSDNRDRGSRNSVFDNRDNSSRSSTSVFDNRDYQAHSDEQTRNPVQASRDDGNGQRVPEFNRPRRSLPVDESSPEENGSTGSRRGAPPELRRNGSVESESGAPEESATTRTTHDEEAILLKAALVNLNVSVTNRSGAALGNLKKEDFDVAENGEAQKIEFFQSTSTPFNLVLALDLSGSIKEKLDVVKSAALRFLEVVGPQDKVAVVSFTDQIRVVSQLTGDREELKRRIKAIDRPQGGTAFYEAMWFALVDTLRGTRGQRNAIVVMTDGVDSSLDRYNPMQSRVSFNQLARRLEEADVLMFPIYLDTEYEEVFERGNSTSEAYAIARDQLDRLAELSGGQSFKAEKVGDLSGVYKQVAAALRTVYSVGYYPTNPEKDGTYRRVRVVVNRPDAAVRTRKGYYAK